MLYQTLFRYFFLKVQNILKSLKQRVAREKNICTISSTGHVTVCGGRSVASVCNSILINRTGNSLHTGAAQRCADVFIQTCGNMSANLHTTHTGAMGLWPVGVSRSQIQHKYEAIFSPINICSKNVSFCVVNIWYSRLQNFNSIFLMFCCIFFLSTTTGICKPVKWGPWSSTVFLSTG